MAPSADVSVVIPTYCEADNLPELVPQVAASLEATGLVGEIIIVDDASPDATPRVCAELAERFPLRLEIRHGRRGLASAVLEGMQLAVAPRLLVMDADLSHPASKIVDLLAALDEPSTDFVIGSRYVAGGGAVESWGSWRRLNSTIATLLARPLTSVRDPMAGFFAVERSTLETAAPLDPIGYKIGLELIVKCDCRQVREVPIEFQTRLHGDSKLTVREQWQYLRHLGRLYRFAFARALRRRLGAPRPTG